MKEERLQILSMIQEGIISAEEGAQLLAALSARAEQPVKEPPRREMLRWQQPSTSSRRWLRIRVTDKTNERDRVNVTIPIRFLDWGIRMIEMTTNVSLHAVRDVIEGGAEGKILEIDDKKSGERIEIFVE